VKFKIKAIVTLTLLSVVLLASSCGSLFQTEEKNPALDLSTLKDRSFVLMNASLLISTTADRKIDAKAYFTDGFVDLVKIAVDAVQEDWDCEIQMDEFMNGIENGDLNIEREKYESIYLYNWYNKEREDETQWANITFGYVVDENGKSKVYVSLYKDNPDNPKLPYLKSGTVPVVFE
jgi:hypothetical protein